MIKGEEGEYPESKDTRVSAHHKFPCRRVGYVCCERGVI